MLRYAQHDMVLGHFKISASLIHHPSQSNGLDKDDISWRSLDKVRR